MKNTNAVIGTGFISFETKARDNAIRYHSTRIKPFVMHRLFEHYPQCKQDCQSVDRSRLNPEQKLTTKASILMAWARKAERDNRLFRDSQGKLWWVNNPEMNSVLSKWSLKGATHE